MVSYSISEAERRDRESDPSATNFCDVLRTIADGLSPKERMYFLTGAQRAAELCGKHVFAFHLNNEF